MTDLPISRQPKNFVPVVDISQLVTGEGDPGMAAQQIGQACQAYGFFYIVGHGVDPTLQRQLEDLSQQFFTQDLETKLQIRMALGGKAWRGYFPIGQELTSGKPDLKEGLYFGTELEDNHPLVKAGTPLHGANLFPQELPGFKEAVINYMQALTQLGHYLMEALSLSLALENTYFHRNYTANPLTLFRVFHYPTLALPKGDPQWGVGEHTDYGLLTILKQDDIGGLQIKSKGLWLDAPPIKNAFICNVGDMLDRLTGGYYRSTPHRVLNKSNLSRFSYPFFFDPNFEAEIKPIDLSGIEKPSDDKEDRWDQTSVHEFEGTYGQYLLGKVSKVFPELGDGLV